MKKELQLHDLLYVNEHLTCYHYMSEIGTGFIYDELKAGEVFPLRTCPATTCSFFWRALAL